MSVHRCLLGAFGSWDSVDSSRATVEHSECEMHACLECWREIYIDIEIKREISEEE